VCASQDEDRLFRFVEQLRLRMLEEFDGAVRDNTALSTSTCKKTLEELYDGAVAELRRVRRVWLRCRRHVSVSVPCCRFCLPLW
jgi:hypothetical protein